MSAYNEGYLDDEKGVANGMQNFDTSDDVYESVSAKQQKRRDQDPLWNCRLITKYPIPCFAVTLGLHLAAVFVMFILLVPGYNILPTEIGEIFMDVRTNHDFLRGLAWEYRNEDPDIVQRVEQQEERSEVGEGMEFYFECKDCNVFTQENLEKMKKAEEKLINDTEFQTKYCYRTINPLTLNIELLKWEYVCSPAYSVLRFFDGSLAQVIGNPALFTPDYPSLFDPTFSNIETVINTANSIPFTKDMLDYFLSKDSVVSQTRVESSLIRGSIAFGLPLRGYSTTWDRREKQDEKTKDFLQGDYYDLALDIHEDGAGEMEFYFSSLSAFYKFFNVIIYRDTMFIIGSFGFIFLFVWLQTCSLFITACTTGSILTSFCIANIIYRFVFDIRYIGNLHFLVIFIVLGIGVDDVFIFNDTWNQTGYYQYKSLAHRLSDCYRRTSVAMLFTTLTTAVSFAVSIASPFLTISTLAIFGALSIIVIYFSVIIYFPAVIIVYHLYFEKKCNCCFRSGDEEKYTADGEKKSRNVIERFFGGPYHKFVSSSVGSPCVIALFTAAVAVFIYFITTIEIDIDMITVNPFRENNNFGKYFDRRINDFSSPDPTLRVFLVWGLKEQDLDECQWSEIECYGKTVYDDDFDLNSIENQQALRRVCQNLKSLSAKQIEDLHIKVNKVTGLPEVDCFLDDMDLFLWAEEANRTVCDPPVVTPLTPFRLRYDVSQTFNLPVSESNVREMMAATAYIYDSTPFDSSYEHWFEIAMSHWMYGGFQTIDFSLPQLPSTVFCVPALRMSIPMMMGMPGQFVKYNELLGEEKTQHTLQPQPVPGLPDPAWLDFTYNYGTKLKYAAIVVNTTINAYDLRYPEGLPIRDDWEDFMDDQLKDMPFGLKNGFQTTPEDNYSFNLWHNLVAQKALVDMGWIGIGVGIGVVFVMLTIGTMNVLLGLLGTINIACITVLVVGLIPMAGWKIEMFQTVILTLVVGFEADYTIHMAMGYSRSAHRDRKSRTRDMLQEVGISIFSGFLSTIGSCFFMFFATLIFFPEFAGIVFATLGFSFIFSAAFFPALLSVIGPEGDFASLKWLCCCCRK